MSNILNILQYLKANESRFITITNQDNGKMVGKDKIYLSDIPNEDLQFYIKSHLGQISSPTLVWIEMRVKQGVTSKKENVCRIEVMPENYIAPVTSPAIVQEPTPHIYQQPSFLEAPQLGNNIFGLGFPEIMGMQLKASQLEEKKEQLADIKGELNDLKQKYNLLEIDHRKALTDLSIAASQKDMAVMLVKAENKSFAESPVFQALIERAPDLISGFVAMKSGNIPVPVAGLGAPSASETHDQFTEFMNEHLNESQVNQLGSICRHMNNENFRTELKVLLDRYAAI